MSDRDAANEAFSRDAVAAALAEVQAYAKAEIAHRDELIAQLLHGEIEAAKIMPAGVSPCPKCGAGKPGQRFLASWSCEVTPCPAGRPRSGVTVAELIAQQGAIDV